MKCTPNSGHIKKHEKLSLKGDSFFMAKKGQKFPKYSNEVVDEVLNDVFVKKYSMGYISRQRNIPEGTTRTWVFKRQRPELFPGHGMKKGRPKKDDPDLDWKERYEILKRYHSFLKAQREKK